MTARTTPLALEIAVTAPAGAVVARQNGADRVELCAALELGGVTPSQGLVEAAVAVGIPVHALVRCRPGDFVYDVDDVALMVREVRGVLTAGAHGVVVGAVTRSRELDLDTIGRLLDAARSVAPDAELTLHRAVDHTADPVVAAGQLLDLGFTRVLTSGGAATAVAGAATIARMVAAAPGVQVMAGSGVTPHDVPALAATGVAAVHLSAKRAAAVAAGGIPMGAADGGHSVTDPSVVAAARAAVDAV